MSPQWSAGLVNNLLMWKKIENVKKPPVVVQGKVQQCLRSTMHSNETFSIYFLSILKSHSFFCQFLSSSHRRGFQSRDLSYNSMKWSKIDNISTSWNFRSKLWRFGAKLKWMKWVSASFMASIVEHWIINKICSWWRHLWQGVNLFYFSVNIFCVSFNVILFCSSLGSFL